MLHQVQYRGGRQTQRYRHYPARSGEAVGIRMFTDFIFTVGADAFVEVREVRSKPPTRLVPRDCQNCYGLYLSRAQTPAPGQCAAPSISSVAILAQGLLEDVHNLRLEVLIVLLPMHANLHVACRRLVRDPPEEVCQNWY